MVFITGPKIDEAVEQLRKWYLSTSAALMAALEEGYPYGSSPQSPQQQLEAFFSMTPEGWQELASRLQLRYRGEDNVPELVRADIQEYVTRMSRLAYGGRP
ncbi:hypothetical protein LCGC14_0875630 [marine sediment metagenome]|uniref:Uncharacterized protein n=1 Tax=marine sediment metagenome TaxID=412755 RepID=A0A0F9P8E8_9ZZZZ